MRWHIDKRDVPLIVLFAGVAVVSMLVAWALMLATGYWS